MGVTNTTLYLCGCSDFEFSRVIRRELPDELKPVLAAVKPGTVGYDNFFKMRAAVRAFVESQRGVSWEDQMGDL
jgi:hypothetical protein